jgi:ABC-2 type transport system permease protein
MATEIRHLPLPAAAHHVSFTSRVLGLGGVFGKTLRDARLGILVIGALLGVMTLAGGWTMATTYGTTEARLELGRMAENMPPILRGMYGNPIRVDTLGGFVSWHYGAYFALLAGLWSILALSSTLGGEAQRGSLEFVLTAPRSRRSVAIEKVAGHVVAMGVVAAAVGAVAWATGALASTMPGDAISPVAAASFAAGLAVRALAAGAVAFALASFIGRGAAAGIAGALMFGGFVIQSYRTVVPAFDTLANASWFSWTAGHVPLAGQSDWTGVALATAFAVALLAIGVEGFARRDVGVTIPTPTLATPPVLVGLRGPLGRSFGDLLPRTLAWGIGLGAYGVLMAASSRALLDALAGSPAMAAIFRSIVPGIDITTAAGFLQLAFAELGFVLIGLAAATFVAARASDETSGRLELLLAAPLTRFRWTIASAAAGWLANSVVVVLLAAAVALGVGSVGQDPLTPAVGTLVLAAYGAALVGIGAAVGGVFRAEWAMPAVLGFAIGTFLVGFLAPALRLPDWVAWLALTTHFGKPLVGTWDAFGIGACLVIAIGGVVIGAWGMQRRDVGA